MAAYELILDRRLGDLYSVPDGWYICAAGNRVEDRAVSIDRLDGVTVDLPDNAWFNLRASNTEPLLRLNVEARTADEIDAIVGQVSETVDAQMSEGSGAVT